MANQWRKKT